MSKYTWDTEQKANFELRTVTVAADYTIKTGRTADGLVRDEVIKLTDPTAAVALTLPDGTFIGQRILVVSYSDDNNKDTTLTVTHHANADAGTATFDAVDEAMELVWTGTEWDTAWYSTGADVA